MSGPASNESLIRSIHAFPLQLDQAVPFVILLQPVLERLQAQSPGDLKSVIDSTATKLSHTFQYFLGVLPGLKGLREAENKEHLERAKAAVVTAQDALHSATQQRSVDVDVDALFAFVGELPEVVVTSIDAQLPNRLADAEDKKQTIIVDIVLVGAVVAVWNSFKLKRQKTEKAAGSSAATDTIVTFGGASEAAGVEVFTVTKKETDVAGNTKTTTTLLKVDPLGLLQKIAQLQ